MMPPVTFWKLWSGAARLGVLAVFGGMAATAQASTWIPAAGGSWGDALNWSGGVPNATDATADFSQNITSTAVITLDGTRTVGSVILNDTVASGNTWSLQAGSGGSLVLDSTSPATPSIIVNNSIGLLGVSLVGSNGVTISGTGTPQLAGNNSGLSGPVTIDVNTQFAAAAAGSAAASWHIAADQNLLFNGNFVSSGTHIVNLGSLHSSSSTAVLRNGGDATDKRVIFEVGSLESSTYAGRINKAASETWLRKVGNTTLTLTGSTSDYIGTIVEGGVLEFTTLTAANTPSSLGLGSIADAGANALSLRLNGGVLRYIGAANVSTNRRFSLGPNGGGIEVANGDLNFTNDQIYFSGNDTSPTLSLLGAGNGGLSLSLGDNGTGASSLVKDGTGTWTLRAVNNLYSGNTTLNAGTLALAAASTNNVSRSAQISVASGATIDVTGLTDGTLQLAGVAAQTLTGDGTLRGSLIVDTLGILAPGSGVGTFTFDGTADVTLLGRLLIDVGSGANQVDLLDAIGQLSLDAGTVEFAEVSPLDQPVYVFARYDALLGAPQFASVVNLPAGYVLDYAYGGNQLALVQVPEPGSLAILLTGGLAALRIRRRRVAC